MAVFRSFEEMTVWQESRVLVRSIRALCKRAAVRKDFAFVDQITRAARSVSANTAEGSESTSHAEFMRFLGIAKQSCGETRSHLFDALDEGYISRDEFEKLHAQAKKICKMIASLIHHLQTLNPGFRRTYKTKLISSLMD